MNGNENYISDVESGDPYEHRLSVLQVHKRMMIAVELQSTHGNALSLQNHIVRNYMFLFTHGKHACW